MAPTQQLRLMLLSFLLGLILSAWGSLALSLFLLVFVGTIYGLSFAFKAALGVVLALAMAYANVYSYFIYPDNVSALVGQSIELKAVVKGETRLSRAGQQTVRLKILAWRQNKGAWHPLKAGILWQNAPQPLFKAGDEIQVTGVVSNIANFSDDFNAQAYWSRWGLKQSLIRATIVTRPAASEALNQTWRALATERLQSHLQKPHLTVALGMLVGLKEKLPPALEAHFKASGLQHLLVVSGTNVTLLVVALGLVLKPLGPWYKYGLSLIMLGAYLYLVGLDPPALRATLFGVLTGLALTSGYNIEYRNLFLLVASLLGIADPRFLTHDVSFWLSFSATAGILFGMPLVYQWLKFIKHKALRLLIGASFCAQMAVFPILIIKFGSFPYAGLISNLLTEPLVPLIMFLAAGGIVLGNLAFWGLAVVWSWALEAAITTLIWIAQTFGALTPIYVSPWGGYLGAIILLSIGFWACVSVYYQQEFWQKLEVEMNGG